MVTSTDTKLGRPDYYCLAALWGVVLLAYWELWMPGRILIKRDAFLFFPPIKQYIVDRLASGHLPEWFPYEGLGRPFLSIPVTGMFHPFTALYAVLSPHDAYRTSVLLSCLIGVSGMFWLGRTLGYSRIAAVGSALTFILSGYACSLTENIVYFYSFCLLPLFCGSLHRAFHEGGRWLVIGAIVWASVLLHGDIQTGYYYGFVALAWAVVRSTKSTWSHCATVMAMAALAGLLASIQLGPAWVVFNESHRMDSGSFYRDASYWSLHPLRLLAMLVGPVGGDWSEAKVASVLYGSDNAGTAGSGLWAESLYLGTIAAGLAWQGIRGRRDLRPVAILGAITLLLALGKYGRLYDLFYTYFPLWSAFRYPERLMSIVTFVLALFTGAGIDVMKSRERSAFPWLLAGLIATLLWVSSIGAQAQWAAVSGLTEETVRVFGSAFALPLLYGALVMLGMAALLYVLRRDVIAMNTALIALVLFSSLDLWRVNARAILVGPSEAATFSPLFAEAIHKERSPDTDDRVRVLSLHDAALVAPGELAGRLDDRALTSIVMKQVLSAEHNASYRIESAQVYLPGFPPEATYLEDHPNPLLSARYNVGYFIGRSHRFQHARFAGSVIAQLPDYDLSLARNPVKHKPRAYLSPHPELVGSRVKMSQLVGRQDFVDGHIDIIESDESLASEENSNPAPYDPEVSLERYQEEEVVLKVKTRKPSVLILLDAYAPGWHATLDDGRPLTILRANGLVRAVRVPSGDQTLHFVFHTPFLFEGACLSFLGALLCILMTFRAPKTNGTATDTGANF
jgi:hypothetical protein